ncbi:hypothetical protein K3495_g13594 [Podosphaera aphanis]|nr:hypothetical protein K3495_g13594 [Podosphaera aphanis]
MYLENVLYVPSLGVNLISAKKLCKNGLKGSFDARKLWICCGKDIVITANQKSGLYIIDHISKEIKNVQGTAAAALSFDEKLTDFDLDDSEPELATTKTQRHWYRLMHRRFNNCGPGMLRKLHIVTSLENQIKIPPSNRRICRTCKLAKMRNLTSKELSEKKKEKLELVHINIAGPFTKSISGNRFLLQVIDSATNKTWSFPLSSKDKAIDTMRRWKKKELRTGLKLKAVRSDNAPELKKLLDEFEEIDGVQNQSTTVAWSHQNELVERDIQTVEESIRAMLKAQDLPLEFWDEAALANAHIRNLQPRGPIINGKVTCPQQAYTWVEPSIENIRVWGSKCYAYVDPKTRHKNDRHDKLMIRGREGVFMGWSEDTDKHLRMYAPDLGYVVRSSRLFVDETVPGGSVDLRLRDCISGPHGTPVDAADRARRGRPRREELKNIKKGASKENEQLKRNEPGLPEISRAIPELQEIEMGDVIDDVRPNIIPEKPAECYPPQPISTENEIINDQPKKSASVDGKKQKINSHEAILEEDPILLPTQCPMSKPSEVTDSNENLNKISTKSDRMNDQVELKVVKEGNIQDMKQEIIRDDTSVKDTCTTNRRQNLVNEGNNRYYFRERKPKRRRSEDEEEDVEERDAKIIRSMVVWIDEGRKVDQIAFPSFEVPTHRLRTYGKILTSQIEKNFLFALTHGEELNESAYTCSLKEKKIVNGIEIPRSYKEAINDPVYSEKWEQAIQEEINSLVRNGTWEEFILPDGANLVSTKWVFDVKKIVFGEIERFKARLVARGFSQQLGVDYTETFAPTVRAESLRMFLAMMAKENLECVQYDIKNAFTESHLKEQIFLAPPEGFKVKKGHVLRALRSLYGLKQAGRDWNLLLRNFLIERKFAQSKADPCVYIHEEKHIKMLVYVDDIIAASPVYNNLNWLYDQLSTRFNTKNLGEISKVLGIRITRDRENNTLYMDQELYLEEVCNSFGITKAKYKMRSSPASNIDSLLAARDDEVSIDSTQYSRIIGKIMFGMVYTRPDIAHTLGRLSQFMKNPVERHGHALKWLIQYIRSTLKQRLRFGPGGVHQNTMGIYSDCHGLVQERRGS